MKLNPSSRPEKLHLANAGERSPTKAPSPVVTRCCVGPLASQSTENVTLAGIETGLLKWIELITGDVFGFHAGVSAIATNVNRVVRQFDHPEQTRLLNATIEVVLLIEVRRPHTGDEQIDSTKAERTLANLADCRDVSSGEEAHVAFEVVGDAVTAARGASGICESAESLEVSNGAGIEIESLKDGA